MSIETNELDLVLDAIHQTCGYDFRQYAHASLQRRLANLQKRSGMTHLVEMVPRIMHDPNFLDQVLQTLSITVTEMFRDPAFFFELRRKVIPKLKELPSVRIWHAGCATGEEVYSLAIILLEEGLYDRARIYATDFNPHALHTAREGVFPQEKIKSGTKNYFAAGGRASLLEYCHAQYDLAKLRELLKSNIVFSHHNLATDGPFGEFDLILCRNVLIYFDQELKQKVFSLFNDSLQPNGFLCLGMKETLDYTNESGLFDVVASKERIYCRKSTEACGAISEGVLV